MSAILDNITFFNVIKNFVNSTCSKAIPLVACFLNQGATQFNRDFFVNGATINIQASNNGRNVDSQTSGLSCTQNQILFPNGFNYAIFMTTGMIWCETITQIRNIVGPNATILYKLDFARTPPGSDESVMHYTEVSFNPGDGPITRKPFAINRGQGMAAGTTLKFKMHVYLYPTGTGNYFLDEAIFTEYPTLQHVGTCRALDCTIISGPRINLWGINQTGG